MKKMIFQLVGMRANKFLGAALVLVGLFLFAQSATAQSSLTPASAQPGVTFKTSNGAQIDFSNLVDAGSAITILKNQYQSYQQTNPSNAKEEVIQGVAIMYISAVAESINSGISVREALVANTGVVDAYNRKVVSQYQVNPNDVLQAAVDALSN